MDSSSKYGLSDGGTKRHIIKMSRIMTSKEYHAITLCRQDCQDAGPISILVQANGDGGEGIPHKAAERNEDCLMSSPSTADVPAVSNSQDTIHH